MYQAIESVGSFRDCDKSSKSGIPMLNCSAYVFLLPKRICIYPSAIRSIKSTLLAIHQHRTLGKRVAIMPTCQGYEGQESRQPGNSGCANKFVSSGRPTCHPCSLALAAKKEATHVINLAFVSPSTGKLESDKSRKTPAVAVSEKKEEKKKKHLQKSKPRKKRSSGETLWPGLSAAAVVDASSIYKAKPRHTRP